MSVARMAFVGSVCGLAGAVLSFFATVLNPQLWQNLSLAQPTVSISSPYDGQGIRHSFILRGEAKNIRNGESLFAVFGPTDSSLYYPSDGPCMIDSANQFTCPVFDLGPYDSKATEYKVYAVRADANAVAGFLAFDVQKKPGIFPGMTQLPGGTTVADTKLFQQQPD